MQALKKFTLTAVLIAAGVAFAAPPQAIHFTKGKSAATITGIVKGYDSALYQLHASAGQTLSANVVKGDVYVNIYAPGDKPGEAEALYNGSESIEHTVSLPANGNYTVQVYQMRAQAHKGRKEPYTVKIAVKNNAAQQAPADRSKIQPHTVQTLKFAKGKSGTSVTGTLNAEQTANYQLWAKAGQTLTFTLDNPHTFLEVYAPNQPYPTFSSNKNAGSSVRLPKSGNYTLKVIQDSNSTQHYRLSVSVK